MSIVADVLVSRESSLSERGDMVLSNRSDEELSLEKSATITFGSSPTIYYGHTKNLVAHRSYPRILHDSPQITLSHPSRYFMTGPLYSYSEIHARYFRDRLLVALGSMCKPHCFSFIVNLTTLLLQDVSAYPNVC